MPSSSFVEVDIQNNDTAILDTSNVVIASNSEAVSPNTKVSQSQDEAEETVVSPTPKKMKTSIATTADAKSVKKPEKKVNTSVVTPKAKSTNKAAANSSLTPPKGAIATPGDSVKKEKKTVRTLNSFFGKGKKKDVATKPLVKIPSKAEKEVGKSDGEKDATQKKTIKKTEEERTEAKKADETTKVSKTVEKKRDDPKESVGKAEKPIDSTVELEDDTSPGYALSVALAKTRTKRGRRSASAVKKVEQESATSETEGKTDGMVGDAKQIVVEMSAVETQAESKKAEKKDTEPADDDTVALEADKIPPPSYDSSSEASDMEMEVVAGAKEVSPIKTDESASSPSTKSDTSKSVKLTSIADSLDSAAASSITSKPVESNTTKETPVTNTLKEGKSPTREEVAPKPIKPTAKKGSPKPKAANDTPMATSAKTESAAPMSEENQTRLKQYATLRERYAARAIEVASRSTSDDFVEESLSTDQLPFLEKGSVEVGKDGGFPDELLPRLLVLIQGSNLPLSVLARNALESLSEYTSEAKSLSTETISSKVKLLAQRKPYLSGTPPSSSEKPTPLAKLDCFEDSNECYLWRWELSSIDLLPAKESSKVKKARTMRKKLQSQHTAIFKLISSIDNAAKWLLKNPTSAEPSPSIPVLAKVSDMEEKVLKFEREEEKARLLKEAKAQQSKGKAEEQAAKQAAKQKEKEEAKRQKEEEKAAAAKVREEAKLEAKRKKDEEKLKQQREAEEKESKRKARFTSFFSAGSAKKKQKTNSDVTKASSQMAAVPSFDGNAFRSMINSQDGHESKPFAKRSQRKTKDVRVSVHVTVLSDNPFDPQPYDEEKVISVHNKYKFLGFHEDHRPPYHGTWSKSSSLVTGRKPFGKDTEYLNYEVDSEAEWEQEDEDGEDCDKSDGEEEDVAGEDDDNDSFLAAEDELGLDEDDDEETKTLRKKKLLSDDCISAKACVIAPKVGGIPHQKTERAVESIIEGLNSKDAVDLLVSHAGRVLTPEFEICLGALPPKTREEQEPKVPATQKMTAEAMKLMAQFVHNSTVKSKEKIITELLNAHPNLASSRAQAMRELEVTAEKRRLPKGAGVVWEVKAEHLGSLGLTEKDLKSPPPVPEEIVPIATKKVAVVKPAKKSPSKTVAKKSTASSPTSAVPVSKSPKASTHSKKRSKPAVSTASANLFAAYIVRGNKKQKTE